MHPLAEKQYDSKSFLQKKIDDEFVNKYLYTSLIEIYLSNNH